MPLTWNTSWNVSIVRFVTICMPNRWVNITVATLPSRIWNTYCTNCNGFLLKRNLIVQQLTIIVLRSIKQSCIIIFKSYTLFCSYKNIHKTHSVFDIINERMTLKTHTANTILFHCSTDAGSRFLCCFVYVFIRDGYIFSLHVSVLLKSFVIKLIVII